MGERDEPEGRDGAERVAVRPYGTWESPVRPTVLAEGIRLSDVAWDSATDRLVWREEQSGRGVPLVWAEPGGEAPSDLTTARSVRARVGYGGGEFTVADGAAYYVADGRLFRQPLGPGEAQALTPAFAEVASPAVSPDGRWVLFATATSGWTGWRWWMPKDATGPRSWWRATTSHAARLAPLRVEDAWVPGTIPRCPGTAAASTWPSWTWMAPSRWWGER